jgi:hypothetical protein
VDEVRINLEADLNELVNAPSNRSYKQEFAGWRERILVDWADAVSSAETVAAGGAGTAFLVMGRYREYSAVARLVSDYRREGAELLRRLADDLDRAGRMLYVIMGETLYQADYDQGGSIMLLEPADLRGAKERAVASLRRLRGLDGQPDTPEDAHAFITVLEAVKARPQLLGLVDPPKLEKTLDEVITGLIRPDAGSRRRVDGQLVGLKRDLAALVEVIHDSITEIGGATGEVGSAALISFSLGLTAFSQALSGQVAAERLAILGMPPALAADAAGDASDAGADHLLELINSRARFAREARSFATLTDGDSSAERGITATNWFILHSLDEIAQIIAMGGGYDLSQGDLADEVEEEDGKMVGLPGRVVSVLDRLTDWYEASEEFEVAGRLSGDQKRAELPEAIELPAAGMAAADSTDPDGWHEAINYLVQKAAALKDQTKGYMPRATAEAVTGKFPGLSLTLTTTSTTTTGTSTLRVTGWSTSPDWEERLVAAVNEALPDPKLVSVSDVRVLDSGSLDAAIAALLAFVPALQRPQWSVALVNVLNSTLDGTYSETGIDDAPEGVTGQAYLVELMDGEFSAESLISKWAVIAHYVEDKLDQLAGSDRIATLTHVTDAYKVTISS